MDWHELSAEEIRETGVLYAVNKFVLWPLGLALAVEVGVEPPSFRHRLYALNDPETIVEGKIDLAVEPGGCHPRERFVIYANDRIALMPTEMEKATAQKAMSKLYAGIGVDPLREKA